MASLWKRANGPQYRMLAVISGAVRNAQQAHGQPVDITFARSVAKRAVGTLSAAWPEVLAADKLPPSGARRKPIRASGSDERHVPIAHRAAHLVKPPSNRQARAQKGSCLPTPVKRALAEIHRDLWRLKTERPEYAEGLIEALRIIDRHVTEVRK